MILNMNYERLKPFTAHTYVHIVYMIEKSFELWVDYLYTLEHRLATIPNITLLISPL